MKGPSEGKPAAPGRDLPARKPEQGGEQEEPESRVSWLMGWVIGPGAVLGAIFGGGVLVGVHYHDGWVTRFVLWVVGLFS